MTRERKFIHLVGWSEYVYPDRRKKLDPPYPWYKQPSIELDTLNHLDGRLFAALCRLRMLACQVGNNIELREQYLRGRCGITRKALDRLTEYGLIVLLDQRPKHDNASKNSGSTPIPPESGRSTWRGTSGPEGDSDSEIHQNSNQGALPHRLAGKRETTGCRRQPAFEQLTRACQEAGLRGSDFIGISELIEGCFDFQPSAKQMVVLEHQIIDRSRE